MIVAAATSNANETILAALDSRPDVVVLSASLPGGVVETIKGIREELGATQFVVLADDADDELMLRVVIAGARGFLLGETDPERLPHAVAGILDGEAAFPRRLVRVLADELARLSGPRMTTMDGGELTPREADVLDALADARTAADVAAMLGITEATVRRHSANAARKLGVSTREEALRLVRERSARGEAL